MTNYRRTVLLGALGAGSVSLSAPMVALANTGFPRRPVTLVVPFAPGGNLDLVARTIGPALQEVLGQSVVVENRAGAGGAIGATAVARAEADGHTLLVTTPNALVVLPRMVKTGYALSSFTPVGLVSTTALLLATSGQNKRWKDAASLIADVRKRPKEISAAHAGPGTSNHVALMQLEDAAKIQFNLIAYKGSAPALVDVMGGQTDLVCDQLSSSIQHIRSGALRPLAQLSRERDPQLAQVPTLHEQGVSGFDASTVTGLLAPKGAPQEAVRVLNDALGRVLSDPQVKRRLLSLGSTAAAGPAVKLGQLLAEEDVQAQKLAQSGRLKAAAE